MILNLIEEIISAVAEDLRDCNLSLSLGVKTGKIGYGGDEIKRVDARSEEIISNQISSFIAVHPEQRIVVISEESGLHFYGDDKSSYGYCLIIDPLDGSNNIRDWRTPSPSVAISIAAVNLQEIGLKNNFELISHGVVMDVFNNRIYSAVRSCGATVKSFGKIQTSPQVDQKDAIVGFDLDSNGSGQSVLTNEIQILLQSIKCQRRLGSSILDFMKVACGEYDSFCSLGGRMKLHDLAAASLIIREAGGVFDVVNDMPDYCLVDRIIGTKDATLLNTQRFKVIASGNDILHRNIMSGARVVQ